MNQTVQAFIVAAVIAWAVGWIVYRVFRKRNNDCGCPDSACKDCPVAKQCKHNT